MFRLIDRARRAGDEQGAIAVLVVVLVTTGVLLGFAALTVDVGRLFAERRELQNGADAAVLAVAQDCAKGLPCDAGTDAGSMAGTYAQENARDSAADVQRVCGAGSPTLPGCPAPSTNIYDCAPTPPSGTNYAEVVTSTRETDGSTLLPPSFAQALGGGYTGATVSACARAAWGPASSMTATLPVTISVCEWDKATSGGTSYAPAPPYSSGYPSGFELPLYLHTTKDLSGCPAGPSGGDLPGGFGWLDSAGCQANVDENGWVYDDPGVAVNSDCKTKIASMVGTIVYVPVFDAVNDLSGANGQYHIAQFAAFYLTGYNLPSAAENPKASIATGTKYCTGANKCLYGWFTTGVAPGGTVGGSGPSMGVNVVSMIG